MTKSFPHIQEDLARGSLSRHFHEELLRELLSVEISPDGIKRAWEGEREFGRNYFKKLKEYLKGKYDEDFLSEMEPAWETLMAEVVKLQIEAGVQNNPDIYAAGIEELRAAWKKDLDPLNVSYDPLPQDIMSADDPLKAMVDELAARKIFPTLKTFVEYLTYLSSWNENQLKRTLDIYYTTMTELTNLIAATAVQLYQLDNQKLPDKLEDLVPKYLAKIPEDPFNSFKPIQYIKNQDGYIVYGFGPDRSDQKGAVAFDLHDTSGKSQEGDIVLSIGKIEK